MFYRLKGISAVLAAIMVALLVLAACGGEAATPTPAPANTAAPSATQAPSGTPSGTQAAPTPTAARGTTPTAAVQPRRGGTLTYAQTADPPTFNIYASTMALLTNHTKLAHSRLVRYKSLQHPENGKYGELTFQGDAAESWTISGDGTVYTFKIKKGVKWHNVAPMNGRDMTAQDVVGAYQLLMYGDKTVFKGDYTDVVKVEAPDASTFVMTIKRARASWMHRIADGEAAWLANPDFVKAKGADYGVAQDSLSGSRPFMPQKAEPGARYTYARNPNYFEQPFPHLDRVQWLIIPDASTREAAFISGQISVFNAGRGDQTNRIMRASPEIKLYESEGLSTQSGGFIFNHKQTKWQDLRVRQAVLYAFPWERVITDLYGGKGAYDGCIPSALAKYSLTQTELKQLYKYDPAKATSLMSAAGFSTASPLAMDIAIAPDFTQDYVDVATMLKSELDKVGFKATIQPVPIAQLRPRLIEGNFDTTVQNLAASIEPDDALGAFVAGNPSNYGHINDPKIEAWFQQQTVELDDAKRGAITKEFGKYCAEQALHLANPKRAGQILEWGYVKNLGINDIAGDETRERFVWIER